MTQDTLNKPKTMFDAEEIKKASVEYFGGDERAASTWVNKYALRDKNGNVLEKTPDDMHYRMAHEFARKEKEYAELSAMNGSFLHLSDYGQKREFLSEEKIFQLFKGFKYVIPQ